MHAAGLWLWFVVNPPIDGAVGDVERAPKEEPRWAICAEIGSICARAADALPFALSARALFALSRRRLLSLSFLKRRVFVCTLFFLLFVSSKHFPS